MKMPYETQGLYLSNQDTFPSAMCIVHKKNSKSDNYVCKQVFKYVTSHYKEPPKSVKMFQNVCIYPMVTFEFLISFFSSLSSTYPVTTIK